MVTIAAGSGPRGQSQEAGVKYFFLGALGAAIFLYGFTLIYGGTGTTNLNQIHDVFMTRGINPIALAGLLLSLIGLCFKLGAVPMHFYIADVYQGAPAPVSAFLAFVPKAAGFVAIILLCAAVGWVWSPDSSGALGEHGPYSGTSLPEPIRLMLWVIAALSMTVGNVLAILQSSVKRLLAYSSIAHSGYMLVGVIAGPGEGTFTSNGISATLFYLLAYGVMNPGTFAVLACLERRDRDGNVQEIDSFEDLRGLCATRPLLGWTMVLCSLSLLGFPPLLGFLGKLPLFTSAIYAGELPLVIVLGINSAIAAFYYLRLFGAVLLEKPDGAPKDVVETPYASRTIAALVSAGGVVVLMFAAGGLMDASKRAGQYTATRTLVGSAVSKEPTDSRLLPSATPGHLASPEVPHP
jgi:NADH-quinone oxidoreductase subunit N